MPNPSTMTPGYFDQETGMFYPYNRQTPPPYPQQYQTPMYASPSPPTVPQPYQPSSPASNQPTPSLKGRVVEDISEVKPGEVSMDGTWHYYPKKDGTKMYVKLWDQKGELRTFAFIPEEPVVEAQMTAEQSKYDEILRRLDDISENLASKKTKKEDK